MAVEATNKIRISGEVQYAKGVQESKSGNKYARAALVHKYPNTEVKAWWNIVSFGDQAGLVGELNDGDLVVVEGQAKPGRREQDGVWIDTRPDVVVFKILERDAAAPAPELAPDDAPTQGVLDEDIPF